MVKVLTVVTLLAMLQIIPSCGGPKPASDDSSNVSSGKPAVVIGWVDEKRVDKNDETLPYIVVINSRGYGVPYSFWRQVGIGDLVKWDGETWTIVRKAKS